MGRRAAGEDSVVAEQLRQALARNVAGQSAIQASARPGQQGMAARLAAQQQAKMGSEIAGQSALARLAEQQQADQTLGQMLTELRKQDIAAMKLTYGQPTRRERMFGAIGNIGRLGGLGG
jgi:hypothetical protein